MTDRVRKRFWLENALAAVSFVAFALTLIVPDWIEAVFGVDPDHGSGALEWTIVVLLLAATLSFAGLARREYRRTAITAE